MARKAQGPKADKKPRRGKKGDNIQAASAGGDTSALDAAYDTQLGEVRKLYVAHRAIVDKQREAAGRYRAAIKVAVSLGAHRDMHASDITKIMKDEDRDPADIDREIKRYNYNAQARKIPIGGQLGLMLDGRSIATAVEDKDAKPGDGFGDMDEIERAGFEAHRQGVEIADCPHPEGSDERTRWAGGWNRSHDAAAAHATEWVAGLTKPGNGAAGAHA